MNGWSSPLRRGFLVLLFIVIMAVIYRQLVPPVPLAKEDLSRVDRDVYAVQAWLDGVLSEPLTLKSEDYSRKLQTAELYFSRQGYEDYIVILQQARAFDALKSKPGVTVGFIADQAPKVSNYGVNEEVYAWELKGNLPMYVQYGEGSKLVYNLNVRFVVSRAAKPSFFGLKITSMKLVQSPVAAK